MSQKSSTLSLPSQYQSEEIIWKVDEESDQLCAYHASDLATPVTWAPQPGAQTAFLSCPVDEVLLEGNRGGGKMQPLDAKVLTPYGWSTMGKMSVGSLIQTPKGHCVRVTHVFDHKKKDIYRVTFHDGSSTEVGADHLWKFKITHLPRKGGSNWRVNDTIAMKAHLSKGHHVLIPTVEPLPMRKPARLKSYAIDPYILGLWLGDGHIRSRDGVLAAVGFTSYDQELLDACMDYGFIEGTEKGSLRLNQRDDANDMWGALKEFGLGDKKALDKFIPETFFLSPIEVRVALLQGLMDTDGTCGKSGHTTFTSISEDLAKGVQQIVWSLGGKATITRSASFLDGVRHHDHFDVYIQAAEKFKLFRLARKQDLVQPYMHKDLCRRVVAIDHVGKKDARCIAINDIDHLYITDDYIVTHNTDVLLMDFAQHVGQGFGKDWVGILFRRTFPELEDVILKADRWFSEIFPEAKYNRGKHRWTFPSGEQLRFAFAERVEDYQKYHGHAYPWMAWEELTNWPDDKVFKKIMSLNRSTNKKVPLKIRATTNPSGCVPYGDVLTTFGWVPIQDVAEGDYVVSVTDTGDMTTRRVTQFHEYPFDGELIQRTGLIDCVFTSNHRWPLLNTARNSHSHRSYEDLPNQAHIRRSGNKGSWKGVGEQVTEVVPGFVLTTEKREIKRVVPSLPIREYAELLGWVISEGCVCERDGAFCIAQNKLATREVIKDLLDRCGFHYRSDPQAFWVSERYWMMHFAEQGKCRDKFIPRWFLDQSSEILQLCFDAMMLGDGSGSTYYTISKQLADDVAELLVKLGWSVSRSSRMRKDRVGPTYSISFLQRSSTTVQKTGPKRNVEEVYYRGNVYCLSVEGTESFILRQGKTVMISSNSGHNWVKARYRLPSLPGEMTTEFQEFKDEEGKHTLPSRISIQSRLDENKVLMHADPMYINKIRASCSSPEEEEAWIGGNWNITAGGMFDDLWEPECHILKGFKPSMIPQGWWIDRSYDHGQSKPFSVGFWAESNGEPITLPDGRIVGQVRGDLIRFSEWYGCDPDKPNTGVRMSATDIARGINERIGLMGLHYRVAAGVADSSIFDLYEPGKSVAGDMAKEGVKWKHADKSKGSRKHGWQQIRTRLENSLPEECSDGNYIRESPGLFVTAECRDFIRTMPVLTRNKKDLDDVNTETEDHIADEVRYRCRAQMRKRTFVRKG